MAIYEIDGIRPVVHPSSYVHPEAVLIGDVQIGPDCYIGPLASLRGDFGRILIGQGANVQEGCAAHAFPGVDVVVERDGHIGHGAILHGCLIGENALVGMNAVIMDGARIGRSAFVAAQSLVKAEDRIPDRHLALGTPARVIRALTEDEIAWKSRGTLAYQRLTGRSLAGLKKCEPRREPEPGRGSVDAGDLAPLSRARRA